MAWATVVHPEIYDHYLAGIVGKANHVATLAVFAQGLNREVGLLWVTAVLFGVAYSGAVIVDEIRKQDLSKEEVEKLHLSIGINHAMIEDPALFLPFGIHPLWLWGPGLWQPLLWFILPPPGLRSNAVF